MQSANQIKDCDFLLKINESKISVAKGISAKIAAVEIVEVYLRAINKIYRIDTSKD